MRQCPHPEQRVNEPCAVWCGACQQGPGVHACTHRSHARTPVADFVAVAGNLKALAVLPQAHHGDVGQALLPCMGKHALESLIGCRRGLAARMHACMHSTHVRRRLPRKA